MAKQLQVVVVRSHYTYRPVTNCPERLHFPFSLLHSVSLKERAFSASHVLSKNLFLNSSGSRLNQLFRFDYQHSSQSFEPKMYGPEKQSPCSFLVYRFSTPTKTLMTGWRVFGRSFRSHCTQATWSYRPNFRAQSHTTSPQSRRWSRGWRRHPSFLP